MKKTWVCYLFLDQAEIWIWIWIYAYRNQKFSDPDPCVLQPEDPDLELTIAMFRKDTSQESTNLKSYSCVSL